MRTGFFLVLGAVLLGCGGGDDTGTASATSGAGGGTGGGGGAAASTGTGADGQNVLFPLAIGREWTFKVTKVGAGGTCGEGTFTSKISDSKELDGKIGYTVTPWCSGASDSALYAPGEGDEVFFRINDTWQTILDGKVADGAKWTFQGLEYSWKFLGMQTITGVVFTDCWGVERADEPFVYSVYCRGVGPIRHHNEVDGNGYDAELVLP